jgi:hypothetical protein
VRWWRRLEKEASRAASLQAARAAPQPPHPARHSPAAARRSRRAASQPPRTTAAAIFVLLPSGRRLIALGRRLAPRSCAAASQRPRDWLGFQGDTGLGVVSAGGGGLDIFGLNNCGPTRKWTPSQCKWASASGCASGCRPLAQVGRTPPYDNWALRAYGPLVID